MRQGPDRRLAPRVATGGLCRIAHQAALGIGATLSHGARVGAHIVVGATVLGAVEKARRDDRESAR